MLRLPRKSLSERDERVIAGLMCHGGTGILGRDRPRDLLYRDPISNEAAELKPRSGNMQRAPSSKLPHHFLYSVVTMPQQHFKVLGFDVVGAPIEGGR